MTRKQLGNEAAGTTGAKAPDDAPYGLRVLYAVVYFKPQGISIGETLIYLSALRGRLGELPHYGKAREIICYCKISRRGWSRLRATEVSGCWKVESWPSHEKKWDIALPDTYGLAHFVMRKEKGV